MVHVRKSANFNPLAPRGARPTTNEKYAPTDDFNPLAPRGARPVLAAENAWYNDISIHSPLAGRDRYPNVSNSRPHRFQSTRPSRGETKTAILPASRHAFQSTRPSRGETGRDSTRVGRQIISIHSPLAGRDRRATRGRRGCRDFNPLAPRGARRLLLWRILKR